MRLIDFDNGKGILLSFVIGGTLGWILDTLYRSYFAGQFSEGGLISNILGFPFPFLPVYGFGLATVFILSKYLLKTSLGIQEFFHAFLLFGILFTIYELIGSFIIQHTIKTTLWDYSGKAIDWLHFLYWGVLGQVAYFVMTRKCGCKH